VGRSPYLVVAEELFARSHFHRRDRSLTELACACVSVMRAAVAGRPGRSIGAGQQQR
jgi:hypothetical protein